MTSVKAIEVRSEPGPRTLGMGTFTFTDAYSVFDWGEMPDPIPHKGASLCVMGAFNFERLEAAGVSTHYEGVVVDGDEPVRLADADATPDVMAFSLANRPPLPRKESGYDYQAFHDAAGDAFVVPLEVVFRNRVPIGSSLRRRLSPADIGLDESTWPDTVVDLDEPLVEFSTKFESSDRYLDRSEADRIAGVANIEEIEALAHRVNRQVTEHATATGFEHDDGKIEVVYHNGELLVADVVGTFDENRFTFDGQQVSKEVIRQFYRRYDPEWITAVESAKAEAKATGENWRTLCDRAPQPLPAEVVETAGDLYAAGAARYTGGDWFDVPELADVLARIETW